MNEVDYNELLHYANSIRDFKKLVASESKQPIAINVLSVVASISKQEAAGFVQEYYKRMEIDFDNNLNGII